MTTALATPAEPAAAEPAAAEPAAAEPAAEEPAAEEPAAEEPAAAEPAADEIIVELVGGRTITVDPSEPTRLAVFMTGRNNAWQNSAWAGAEATAAELGIEYDIFDGQFDPAVQFQQYENALQTGRYNGFVVLASDGKPGLRDHDRAST